MSSLVVMVVEDVLGAPQFGSMSAARPIPAGMMLYAALQESGFRVGLLSARDRAGVERFLSANRVRGQAWVRYGGDLEEELQLAQGEGNRVTLVVTPRRLGVERVSQCVFVEDVVTADPLVTEGYSRRRRENWAEMMAAGKIPGHSAVTGEDDGDETEDDEPRE